MIQKNARLVTAEAVRRGHPDKFCDQVADAILDAHLSYDPNARAPMATLPPTSSRKQTPKPRPISATMKRQPWV